MLILFSGIGAVLQYAFDFGSGLALGVLAGFLVVPFVPSPSAGCAVRHREAPVPPPEARP